MLTDSGQRICLGGSLLDLLGDLDDAADSTDG